MVSFPTVGGDNNTWGTKLREWALVGHNSDGTSKSRYNVREWGAKGDGTTDDTTAIQAVLDAVATAGEGTVSFPPATYIVSSSLLYSGAPIPGKIRIDGHGSTLKVKTGTALATPVLASKDWYNNSLYSGYPIVIRDLRIDGNSATSGSGAHGFTTMNYWSRFEDLFIQGVAGDGFLYTAHNRAGTHIDNTCVEPKIRNIEARACGGDGIHVKDNGSGTNSCTDGFLENCLVAGAGARGINCEMGPGWFISGCHIYGTGTEGLSVGKGYGTRIGNIYIDGFGLGGNTYIAGISLDCLDGRGSSISHCKVGFESGAATGPYHGIRVTGAGSAAAVCDVAHNMVKGGSQSGSIAYVMQTNVSQQGQPWTVHFHSNDSMNVATRLYQDSYVTIADQKVVSHFGSEGPAVTAAAGAQAGTSPPAPVLTRATDLGGKVTWGTGSSPAAGAQCVITFANAYGQNPIPVVTPINAATTALDIHVDRTTTTLTISCGNAPAASQGNTVYGVFYHVFLST